MQDGAQAWSLKDVRLKVEAFDYLQLPINITEGCIGRLVDSGDLQFELSMYSQGTFVSVACVCSP